MQFSLYSYNIHSGKDLIFRKTFPRIIQFFLDNKADIISLQEVQNNSKFGWQFNDLQKSLNMNGIFGANLNILDGSYGNAIFTRFPILQHQNLCLPSTREQRGVFHSIIDLNGIHIHCYNTHLALGKKERNVQLDILHKLIADSNEPTILLGDFNTTTPPKFNTLQDLASLAGMETQSTVTPLKRRIDYIFVSHHFKLVKYEVVELPYSDHFPLRSVLELT
ncbi:MAG TPA: endonuclease/exonuclease/phosphatase family protein [Bacillota bacterium]|nr:endonuclease/exonuclease/phosphatase family protein [Bacillota bacterium]